MKAGRELDALIAEKVMGDNAVYYPESDMACYTDFIPGCDILRLVPPYSTQIADAWLVVEKMKDSGYCVELFYDMVAWSVSFMHIDRDEKHGADWRNSIETQICLAALKAVE